MNQGRWNDYEEVTGEGSNTYECSECGFVLQLMEGDPKENEYNYCPRCGAKLRADERHAYYEYSKRYGRRVCSNCGIPTLLDYNQDEVIAPYCYSCGCRMDEVTE